MLCVDAIAAVTKYMSKKLDKKTQVQECVIDLQSFDTLDHELLISKLDSYGFICQIHNIICKSNSQYTAMVHTMGKLGKPDYRNRCTALFSLATFFTS